VLTPLSTRALGRNAGEVRNFVVLLLGVVGLTLLIGCANLANLLLAKAAARRREIGVRLALGATRARIVQQMLAESVLLAAIGGAAALGVAAAALGVLSQLQLPGGIAIESMGLQVNGAALAVTCGLSLATGLLFGVVPALRASRTSAVTSLRDQGHGRTSGSGVRNTLLGAQVALSLVLLTGTGLFIRGLSSALQVPLGFDERGVVTASVNLGLARYDEARAGAFFEAALDRVRALPQVESAAWGNLVPTRGVMMTQTEVDGYARGPDEDVTVYGAHVGPGYLETVGTRLRAGRSVTSDDRPSSPPVAVINERMAGQYWAGRNPIGGRFRMFDQWITVVGVVENTIVRELTETPVPHVYLAFDQWLTGRQSIATNPAHLFVRTRIDPAAAVPLVREQLRAVDPEVPMYDVVPFADRVVALVMPQRMGVALFTLFSALALALASVGIYGVATYVASLRTREIGIRIALGATTGAVRRMVLVQGARPIVAGILAGLAMAIYAGRLAEAFLLNVSPMDPLTFVAVPLAIAAIALVASYVPARRASRIEPVQALRDE
jgi:predicted permease